MKKARVAQTRLRRLTGQIRLSPENRSRRVQAACLQAAALFGAELWWKEKGTLGNRDDIQKLVNQEARASAGAFRTTNTEPSARNPGLLPAAAQLNCNNRKRRFAVRLISLPKGNQARELVGAANTLGSSLESFLGHPGRREETVLLTPRRHDNHQRRSGSQIRSGMATTRPGHLHR